MGRAARHLHERGAAPGHGRPRAKYNQVSNEFWNAVHDVLSRPGRTGTGQARSSSTLRPERSRWPAGGAPAEGALVARHRPAHSRGGRPAGALSSPIGYSQSRVRVGLVFLAPMLVVLAAGGRVAAAAHRSGSASPTPRCTRWTRPSCVGLENYIGASPGCCTTRDWWGTAVQNTLRFAALSVLLETVLGLSVAAACSTAPSRAGAGAARRDAGPVGDSRRSCRPRSGAGCCNDQFGIINHDAAGARASSPRQDRLDRGSATRRWRGRDRRRLEDDAVHGAADPGRRCRCCPSDCYEAAQVDGVHPVKVFFQVTLPLIMPGADGRGDLPRCSTRCASST